MRQVTSVQDLDLPHQEARALATGRLSKHDYVRHQYQHELDAPEMTSMSIARSVTDAHTPRRTLWLQLGCQVGR